MSDTLVIGGTTYSGVAGFKATDSNDATKTYIRPDGAMSIATNDTYDVTNYASAVVNVPTGTARTSSDLSANGLTVTAPAGLYASAATKTLTDANLTAGNIKKDVSIFGVTGSYEGSGGSSKNVQAYIGYATRKATTYGATDVTLTVAKTGTYTISWCAWRSSSQGTMGTNLYIGSTAGTNNQTFTGTYGQCITLTGQSLTQGTVLTLYATSGSTSRSIYVGNLIIEEE